MSVPLHTCTYAHFSHRNDSWEGSCTMLRPSVKHDNVYAFRHVKLLEYWAHLKRKISFIMASKIYFIVKFNSTIR